MRKLLYIQNARLILYSDFLTKDKSYEDHIKWLEYDLNEGTPPKNSEDIIPENIRSDFNRFGHEWIQQSMKEWKRDPNKFEFELGKEISKPIKCQLCDTKLDKNVYSVINKNNNERILIGKNCVKNVLRQTVVGNNYTAEEEKRSEELENSYPELFDFINDRPTNKANYEMPDLILNLEKGLISRGKKLIDVFVKENIEQQKLIMKLMAEVKMLENKVAAFNIDSNEKRNLSKKLKNRIIAKTNSKSKYNRIAKIVQKNYGKLDTESAALITDEQFMSQYLDDLKTGNILKGIIRNVINISGSTFAIKLHNSYNEELHFIFKSSDIIKHFDYINPNINDENTKKLISNNIKLRLYQFEDRQRAYKIGIRAIKEAKIVNIDYRVFVHSVNENNIKFKLFEEMMSDFTVFNKNGKYAMLSNKEIIEFGRSNFICSIIKNELEPINFIWKDKDAIFNDLLDKYEIRYNMK